MRTVLLLRHAKSSWADPGMADADRPLAPRGRRAAAKIAEHLRGHEPPAQVLCSSARRTRETLDLIAPALGDGCERLIEDGLYGASASELLERLRRVPDSVASVLVIAHNPAIHDLAATLAGRGVALTQLREGFPTAALAVLRCDADGWRDVGPGDAEVVDFVVPRDL